MDQGRTLCKMLSSWYWYEVLFPRIPYNPIKIELKQFAVSISGYDAFAEVQGVPDRTERENLVHIRLNLSWGFPHLVVSNLAVCNFLARRRSFALFGALLCSFADWLFAFLCAHSRSSADLLFAFLCAHSRSFAPLCIQLHLHL